MTASIHSPEDIPSVQAGFLRLSLGKTISFVRRFEVNDEYFDMSPQIFTEAEGPLIIGFVDGSAIGFGFQPKLDSVTVWQESDEAGVYRDPSTLQDPEMISLNIQDESVSPLAYLNVVGEKITKWSIHSSSRTSGAPNEQALVAWLSSGQGLALTYSLPTGTEDFQVRDWKEVENELKSFRVKEISLSNDDLQRKGYWWVESSSERIQMKDRNRFEYQNGSVMYTMYTEPDTERLPIYINTLKKADGSLPISESEAERIKQRVVEMLEFSGDPYDLIK